MSKAIEIAYREVVAEGQRGKKGDLTAPALQALGQMESLKTQTFTARDTAVAASAGKMDKAANLGDLTDPEAALFNIGAPSRAGEGLERLSFRNALNLPYAKPTDFGAVGDGETPDDAAFAALAEAIPGARVDLEGRAYKLDAMPTGIQPFNGDIIAPGRKRSMRRKPLDHMFDGQAYAALGDGIMRTQIMGMYASTVSSRMGVTYKRSTVHNQPPNEPPMPCGLELVISTDNCQTWQFGKTILTGEGYDYTDVADFVGQNGRWIALVRMKDNNAYVYKCDVTYSDDDGKTWTVVRNVLPNPTDVAPYGKVVDTGTHYLVAGYRTQFRVAYSSYGQNGTVWASFDPGAGKGPVWEGFVEPSFVRLPGQQKYIVFLRKNAGEVRNMWVCTCTNPLNANSYTTPVETEINLGYNTVYAAIKWGRLFAYLLVRDFDETIALQNEMLVIEDDPEHVYETAKSAGSYDPPKHPVFTTGALRQVMDAPDRFHGYWRYIERGDDIIFGYSAWEAGTATGLPGPSSIFIGSTRLNPLASPAYVHQAISRQNRLRNGTFQHWSRGPTIGPITAPLTRICDGWMISPSGSTVFAKAQEVPREVAAICPFNPRLGLRIEATAEDNIALQQDLKGLDAMHEFSDRMVTCSVWGYGDIPPTASIAMFFNYGTGGSAQSPSAVYNLDVVEGANGLWNAWGRLQLSTLRNKIIGTNPYARFQFICSGFGAWDVQMLGIKLEIGQEPSRFDTPNFWEERARCDRFLQVRDFSAGSRVGVAGFAPSANNLWADMTYPPMVRAPGVSFLSGAATDLEIYRNLLPVTAATFNQIERDQLQIRATVASGLAQDGPGVLRVKSGAAVSILLDAE